MPVAAQEEVPATVALLVDAPEVAEGRDNIEELAEEEEIGSGNEGMFLKGEGR